VKANRLRSVDGGVRRLSWSADGAFLAWGTDVGGVGIDLADGFAAAELSAGSGVLSLSWSPDGERLAVGTEGGRLLVWGIGGDAVELDLGGWVSALAWGPMGRLAVGSGSHVTVYESDLATCEVFPFVGGHVNDLEFVDQRLAVGTRNGILWLFDDSVESADPVRYFNPGSVLSLAWDGRRHLASGDVLGCLRIADVDTGEEWSIDGFPEPVDRVRWCGRFVVAPAYDDLTVWGLGTDGVDPLPFRLTGHAAPILDVAVRQGRIASVDEDGVLVLWPIGMVGEPLYCPLGSRAAVACWHPLDWRLHVGTVGGDILTVCDRR
jgi:WD40 repeat protein